MSACAHGRPGCAACPEALAAAREAGRRDAVAKLRLLDGYWADRLERALLSPSAAPKESAQDLRRRLGMPELSQEQQERNFAANLGAEPQCRSCGAAPTRCEECYFMQQNPPADDAPTAGEGRECDGFFSGQDLPKCDFCGRFFSEHLR